MARFSRTLLILAGLLVAPACSDSPSEPDGPMQLIVALDQWLPGELSTFITQVANWDGNAILAYRVLFCPDVVIDEWSEELDCSEPEVVEENSVVAERLTSTYEWDGCGGTAVFSAALLRGTTVLQRAGAVAGC